MRRLILLLLSLALLLGLGGCMPYVRQTPEEERTLITVGFSQVGAESDWRVANTESMRQSLSEENGFELLFDNARQKQENQFKAIRTFIQQDVDYIVLAPVTETGWESVLEEARAAAIPVIFVDFFIDAAAPEIYTSWVGSNFRKTADEAVAWLSEKLKADGREEAVQILHLQGTPGSTAQLQRSAALAAGAAAHADWTIAAQLNGDFTQAKAYEETIAYLQSSPAPDVVYCENDNMCFGVMQAMDEMHIAYGKGGVTLISFDAVRTALSADYEPTDKAIQNYYDTYLDIQKSYMERDLSYYDYYTSESVNLYMPAGFRYVKNLLIAIPDSVREEIASLRADGKDAPQPYPASTVPAAPW